MNKDGLNKLLKKLETIPNQEKMCKKPHHRSNKNIFLSMMKKELFSKNSENVQISFKIDKEKLNKLDSTIDALNKKLNNDTI